jgi:hypothetical protein
MVRALRSPHYRAASIIEVRPHPYCCIKCIWRPSLSERGSEDHRGLSVLRPGLFINLTPDNRHGTLK